MFGQLIEGDARFEIEKTRKDKEACLHGKRNSCVVVVSVVYESVEGREREESTEDVKDRRTLGVGEGDVEGDETELKCESMAPLRDGDEWNTERSE